MSQSVFYLQKEKEKRKRREQRAREKVQWQIGRRRVCGGREMGF